MRGWVRIDRSSWKHDFFPKEPMSELEAWHWMVARAAWEDTTHSGVTIPRGSFMETLRGLQSRFMWGSDKRVRNFLNRLENAEMIGRKKDAGSNAKKTHITICNYDKFQDPERKRDANGTQKRRTKKTNKQNNNTPAGAISSIEEKINFWAAKINSGEFVAASSITPSLARAILGSGKVSPEKMKERGIAA